MGSSLAYFDGGMPPTTCLAGPAGIVPPLSTPLIKATTSSFTDEGYLLLKSLTDIGASRWTAFTLAGCAMTPVGGKLLDNLWDHLARR